MIDRYPANELCGTQDKCNCCHGVGADSVPTLCRKMGVSALDPIVVAEYEMNPENRVAIRIIPGYIDEDEPYLTVATRDRLSNGDMSSPVEMLIQPDRIRCAWMAGDGHCEAGAENPESCALKDPAVCFKRWSGDDSVDVHEAIQRQWNAAIELENSWRDPAVQEVLKKAIENMTGKSYELALSDQEMAINYFPLFPFDED